MYIMRSDKEPIVARLNIETTCFAFLMKDVETKCFRLNTLLEPIR